MPGTIQSTTNYDQFSLMVNNRVYNRGHVEALKRAFESTGNLTEVQPILVNERLEIIDGQHRFIAAKDLGVPVFYTIRPGLGVHEAREMNILHKGWRTEDFAHSFAASGDRNYIQYEQLKEDYGFGHSIILSYIYGSDDKGIFGKFRQGELNLTDIEGVRERLDKLAELLRYVRNGVDNYLAKAFLKIMSSDNYDHGRMMRKMSRYGELYIRRFGSVVEYMRALEEIYNHGQGEGTRVRLY